jgi:hypothetical protein
MVYRMIRGLTVLINDTRLKRDNSGLKTRISLLTFHLIPFINSEYQFSRIFRFSKTVAVEYVLATTMAVANTYSKQGQW